MRSSCIERVGRKGGRELTIIGGVFLAGDHGLGVEERPVRAGPHIVDNALFQVHVYRARDIFSCSGLGKERRKLVVYGLYTFLNTALCLYTSDPLALMTKKTR